VNNGIIHFEITADFPVVENKEGIMKKLISFALVLVMILSFAACTAGNKPADTTATPGTNADGTPAGNQGFAFSGTTEKIDDAEYYVFVVNKRFVLMNDAWLGICEEGNYKTELEADEKDEAWGNAANYDATDEKAQSADYRFLLPASNVNEALKDGKTHTMVLCSSDNEETGVVVFSIPVCLKSGKIVLDYDKYVEGK